MKLRYENGQLKGEVKINFKSPAQIEYEGKNYTLTAGDTLTIPIILTTS